MPQEENQNTSPKLPTPLVKTPSGPLTVKQDMFVDALVSNGGKKQAAALQAGYEKASAGKSATALLKKDPILSEIYRRTKLSLASATPMLLDTLMGIALNGKSERLRMEAAQDLLTRAGFSAPERIDHRLSGDINVSIDISS